MSGQFAGSFPSCTLSSVLSPACHSGAERLILLKMLLIVARRRGPDHHLNQCRFVLRPLLALSALRY